MANAERHTRIREEQAETRRQLTEQFEMQFGPELAAMDESERAATLAAGDLLSQLESIDFMHCFEELHKGGLAILHPNLAFAVAGHDLTKQCDFQASLIRKCHGLLVNLFRWTSLFRSASARARSVLPSTPTTRPSSTAMRRRAPAPMLS